MTFRCKYKENNYLYKDNVWWIKAGTFGFFISEVKNESVLKSLNEIMEKEFNDN